MRTRRTGVGDSTQDRAEVANAPTHYASKSDGGGAKGVNTGGVEKGYQATPPRSSGLCSDAQERNG